MNIPSILAVAAIPVLLAGAAFAQTSTFMELEDADNRTIEPFALTADQIEDMDLWGPGGERIGEIEDVLVDADGRVVGFAVETERFLGIGDKDVVIGLDQLRLAGDRFATDLTKDQLEQLPKWDD